MKINLPEAVQGVAQARNRLREQYISSGLSFTPDGKFVGDLGEAIAAEVFGISLKQGKHIDGYSRCGKPVQIKATGRPKGGILFRNSDFQDAAHVHLIAFYIDWDECEAEIIYNGPEAPVRPVFKVERLQREVSRSRLLRLNAEVADSDRLQPDAAFLKK